MPQPKKPTGAPTRRRTSTASSAGAAKKSSKPATAKKGSATTKRAAAPKVPATRPRATRPVAQAAPGDAAAAALRDEALRSNIAALRDVLAGGVVLTAQRVQEAMDDAVSRGRLTRDDAEQIVQGLVSTGRRQALDVLADIEQLLGRSRSDLDEAARRVRETAAKGGDKALRGAEKVRRAAKLGAFPILRYDDLTAAAITERLADLDPAELRKVRDYEARNANRKSVLAAVDKALS
jgi:polyhydroxyalkanoate synthesis regulator phasin